MSTLQGKLLRYVSLDDFSPAQMPSVPRDGILLPVLSCPTAASFTAAYPTFLSLSIETIGAVFTMKRYVRLIVSKENFFERSKRGLIAYPAIILECLYRNVGFV